MHIPAISATDKHAVSLGSLPMVELLLLCCSCDGVVGVDVIGVDDDSFIFTKN